MFKSVLLAGVALVAAGSATAVRAQDALVMRTVRFYRPDVAQTLVKVFVDVPFALMQPAGTGENAGGLVYTVAVQVADSAGLSLLASPATWTRRVGRDGVVAGASGLETVEFAVTPGRYRVEATVTDSVSGRKARVASEVRGFASPPAASDLLLSGSMRAASAEDSIPMPGEIRRGKTILVPTVSLRLTPMRTTAYYLLEAYSDTASENSALLQVSVTDTSGRAIFQTSPSSVPVPAGGGTLQGQLDLDGLPPGAYEFVVNLTMDGKTIHRSAPFSMASLQEALATRAALGSAAAPADDDAYFAAMDEAQLDSAEAPLILIGKSSELRGYDKLSVSAKRRFLAEFWHKRDPTPNSPRNEERERFYQAIAYTDQAFRVGRGTQEPGWRSDRGRIYAKYGAASDQLSRVQNGAAPSYQVWRYTRGRMRYYVFADQNGFGAYKLIYTNDLTETGVPNWREILSEPAVRDVGQYLGLDFYSGSGIGS